MTRAQVDTDNNFTPFRLLLALLVVLGHFQLLAGVALPPWPFEYATTAVDCFFVVSGYLVSNSFDRDPKLGRFYIRRFFRIYPLYAAVVAAQTLVMGTLAHDAYGAEYGSLLRYFVANAVFANFLQHDTGSGVLNGLVVANLNPSLWTLKIEFGFYLLLPLLWRGVERWGVPLVVAVFALSAAYNWGLGRAGHAELARQLPGQLQFFVLGVAAYRYRSRIRLSRGGGLAVAIGLGAVLTVFANSRPPVVYPLIVAAFVPVVALATPRLRLDADISYGVYLLHGPVIQLALLSGFYRSDGVGLAAILGLVIPVAWAAARLIETPGITLGRRLGRRLGRFASVPAGGPAAPPP